jgi:transcriptional regulator with XRE-family HTH domain
LRTALLWRILRQASCDESTCELMDDTTRLGAYLRAERERRGLALRAISENTKVSLPLLEGLEADDISRWPGGIFRRAFVRAYAEAVGLDPDDIFKRFEQQHRPPAAEGMVAEAGFGAAEATLLEHSTRGRRTMALRAVSASKRVRVLGTAADLTVAMVLAFGSAAAGSRLLWPVLMIAAYYAAGVLLTGTTPMVALLSTETPDTSKPSHSGPSHSGATGDDADPLHA